jgi:hypothetical protein
MRSENSVASVTSCSNPKPPSSQESNWLYTQAGKKWFPWFRLYGPEKAVFDTSFTLRDIEQVK